VVVVLSDPFRWRISTETKQSGHAPRSGPQVRNRKSRLMPKMARRSGSDAGQSTTSRRFSVVLRSPPLSQEVGRNNESTTPRVLTIRSPPIFWKQVMFKIELFDLSLPTKKKNKFWILDYRSWLGCIKYIVQRFNQWHKTKVQPCSTSPNPSNFVLILL